MVLIVPILHGEITALEYAMLVGLLLCVKACLIGVARAHEVRELGNLLELSLRTPERTNYEVMLRPELPIDLGIQDVCTLLEVAAYRCLRMTLTLRVHEPIAAILPHTSDEYPHLRALIVLELNLVRSLRLLHYGEVVLPRLAYGDGEVECVLSLNDHVP